MKLGGTIKEEEMTILEAAEEEVEKALRVKVAKVQMLAAILLEKQQKPGKEAMRVGLHLRRRKDQKEGIIIFMMRNQSVILKNTLMIRCFTMMIQVLRLKIPQDLSLIKVSVGL